MSRIDISLYGPVIAELLRDERLAALGPGTPNAAARPLLKALNVDRAFVHVRLSDRKMADCCLAGLWLYHDCLDESHALSQEIDTPSGSYWHGILHRREPDASNAAYWFRRVGDHPVFPALAQVAQALDMPRVSLQWNPFAFIDACEKQRGTGSAAEAIFQRVQSREWELLFDWCFRQAVGSR